MKSATLILFSLILQVQATDELCYHNTTPEWLSWGGAYRGTWFHVEDFHPGAAGYTVLWAEVWFCSPQPDSMLTIELWNGDSSGPLEFLAGEAYTGTVVSFSAPVETDGDFWCVVNSEGYSGTASLITDGESDGHSFFSDDGMIWDDFSIGEYFISVGNEGDALSRLSWGRIKCLF